MAAHWSWRTALVGLLAVSCCAVSVDVAPGAVGYCGAGLALIMLAIAVSDWQSFIIPDRLNLAGAALAVVHAAAREPDAMISAVANATLRAAVLALMFFTVRQVYARVRGRQGLGLGDVKLAGVAGAWLGVSTIPISIELAVAAALSGYVVRQMISQKPVSRLERLPFGFFFAPSVWLCWLIEMLWF